MGNVFKFFCLGFLAASFCYAKNAGKKSEYSGVVISCHDGDTCRISTTDKLYKVRFFGIDAPELNQDHGPAAKKFLNDAIKDKAVKLTCLGKSYDRITCEVWLDGKSMNREMVRSGWALDSPKYSMGSFKIDEQYAKQNKLGIWKSGLAKSPHCYRNKNDKRCFKNSAFVP